LSPSSIIEKSYIAFPTFFINLAFGLVSTVSPRPKG
jgi:hypothetical protein